MAYSFFLLPYDLLKFWYFEAPFGLLKYFQAFNRAFLHLVSLPLLAKTFFQPLKNEYRKGLVAFSIGMGIAIKSLLIAIDFLLFIFVLVLEALILVLFLLFPLLNLALLFV